MVRRAIAAACVALASIANANAQTLPRLHITALGMHADRATVAPGDIYHLTIHVHVTERRDRLDELQLPSLTDATDLGDERRRVAAPDGGTDFYEIMTVSSPDPGVASFTPAYIDAIDPATNKGMRYSSQPLTVLVSGAGALDALSQHVDRAVRDLALVAGAAVVLAGAAIVLVVRRRRRPRRVESRAPAAAAPPPPPRAAVDPLRDAVARFRAHRDEASLDALRAVLFARAGARPGATLTDALHAVGAGDPQLVRAMATAERVRFGPAAERAAATRDLDGALDALLGDAVPAR